MNTFLRSIIIFFLQLARPAAALLPSLPRQNSHQQNRRAWTTWTNPRALPSENAIEEGVRDEEEAARLRRELAQTREAVLLLEQKRDGEGAVHERMLNQKRDLSDDNYVYRSYTKMRQDIRDIVAKHPRLFDLKVAEKVFDVYGAGYTPEKDCDSSECETFIVEIGNKNKLPPK